MRSAGCAVKARRHQREHRADPVTYEMSVCAAPNELCALSQSSFTKMFIMSKIYWIFYIIKLCKSHSRMIETVKSHGKKSFVFVH